MKKIVICGSMSLIEKMKDIASKLNLMGYATIFPAEEDWSIIPPEKTSEFKRKVSMQHFSEIAKEDTHAILVVNDTKKGICNYIGANSFAEIALAFYFGKKIFLLNDVYSPYEDELFAWGAVPLKGELTLVYSHIPQ